MGLNRLYTAFFSLLAATALAQVGGNGVYQFLNLPASARQAALGGKVITIYDHDVNQGQFNPASINPEMDNRLAMNYSSYFGEVTYGSANYAYVWDRRVQTLHAGVNYVNYGTFEGYDENGMRTSDFTGSEIALSLGYAFNIPWTDWHVGANLKLINSSLESYSSFGAAVDLGAVYLDERNNIVYAIVLRNLGTQITTYNGTQEKLPFEILAGISQKLEHVPLRWHITLEQLQKWDVGFSNPNRAEGQIDGPDKEEKVGFLNTALRHVIVGAELFPDKGFNIRLSYNFRRGEELRIMDQRHFSGVSAGVGLKMGRMKFDYSYSRFTIASDVSMFGLTINLGDDY